MRVPSIGVTDLSVTLPGHDPPGARHLDHRLRTGPRHLPRSSRASVPAHKVRRAGQPVHPQETSFTATRHATASLAAPVTTAQREEAFRDLGSAAWSSTGAQDQAPQAFPATGAGTPTRKAPVRIAVCGPLAA